MNFKQWVEDQERSGQSADPATTIDHVPLKSNQGSTQDLSRHAWGTTPGGGNDKTRDNVDSNWDSDSATLPMKIMMLLSPPRGKKWQGKPGLDGHLWDRKKDGKTVASFQGSAPYVSPEEARKMFHPTMEYEADTVETLLNKCADLFVWLEKPCKTVSKLWLKFRSLLHMNEGVQPHVVNYQTNIMRLKDCDTIFPQVNNLVQNEADSVIDAGLVKAWQTFYSAWEQIAPTLKHYLVTFEKNTKRL